LPGAPRRAPQQLLTTLLFYVLKVKHNLNQLEKVEPNES
jgi:hypothetical protein